MYISELAQELINTKHSRDDYPYKIERRGHPILLFALGTMKFREKMENLQQRYSRD